MIKSFNVLLAILSFTFYVFAASAAVPLRWTVETSRTVPAKFEAYQGETLALEAALTSYGKPLEAPLEYSIYWQTNGMGRVWWSLPCRSGEEASSQHHPTNVLFATWSPEMDVGAKAYTCFIGLSNSIYHAAFQLQLRPSPGSVPNALPLPTPVIDFSRVTVLNPPWSGGGGSGGVDTNAFVDIVRKTVDGAAKMLPKYLWCMDFDDSYPDDAEWYYAQPQDYGSCSAVRDGGFLYRNLDWKFSDAADVVVRMSAGPGRFASVGVANCGTNLTEEIVASGKPSRYFKCLPGRTVDGINENGVCAEVNVVGGDPGDRWDNPDGDIHPLAAVRWALDNATSAGMAASNLASRITFPTGWEQNFHWMVADSAQTWIVENGECSNVTGRAVMTNFPLLPTPTYGPGWERYLLLQDSSANITNAWFTRAYSPDTEWISEFGDVTEMDAAKIAWNNGKGKESHRGQHDGDKWWWQTVHTSVYALTNRTLRICVQETPDWYTFTVPAASSPRGVDENAVREIVEPMVGAATNGIPERLSALQSEKRDMTDEGCYNRSFTQWAVGTSESDRLRRSFEESSFQPTYNQELGGWNVYQGVQDADDPSLTWFCGYDVYPGGPDILSIDARWNLYGIEEGKRLTLIRNESVSPDASHVLARRDATAASALAKFDNDGNLTADTNATAEVAKVKDKADEFTAWVYDKPNVEIEYLQNLGWHPKVGGVFNGDENSLELHWSSDQSYYNIDFSATRKRVLRTGDAATPQDLQDAMSPTNHTFSNAVVTVARELTPPALPYMRQYDSVLHCWWIGRMVNGVIEWEVE